MRVGRNDVTYTRPGYQVQFKMAGSEVASFKTNFLRIATTSDAESSMSGEAECFVLGEDKKGKLFGAKLDFFFVDF